MSTSNLAPLSLNEWWQERPWWVKAWTWFRFRTPCWLSRHAFVMLDPTKDPRIHWCMKCNRLQLKETDARSFIGDYLADG
jgi:hypothetical protein